MSDEGGHPEGGWSDSPPVAERMQALLSRAVEDQLTEQRQLGNVLAEIRAALARLPYDVQSSLRDPAFSEAPQLLHQLLASVDDVRVRLDVLDQRIGALEADAGRGDVRDQLARLADEQRSQAAALHAARSGFAALPAFPEQLSAVQNELSGLHERLSGIADLQHAVAELGTRVGEGAGGDPGTRRALDELSRELGELTERVGELPDRLAALPQRDEFDGVAFRIAERVDALEQRQSRTEGHVAPLGARLGELHERLGGLAAGDAVRSVDERLTAVHGRLDELTGFTGALAAVAERVEALRQTVDGLEERLAPADPQPVAEGLAGVRDALVQLSGEVASLTPLREEVATLRALVTGADGVTAELAQLRAAVGRLGGQPAQVTPAAVAAGTREAVRGPLAELERRLAVHVDEAVFALAEALLRRRPGRPPAPAQPEPAQPDAAQPEHLAQPETGRAAEQPEAAWVEPAPAEAPAAEQPEGEQPEGEQPEREQPEGEQPEAAWVEPGAAEEAEPTDAGRVPDEAGEPAGGEAATDEPEGVGPEEEAAPSAGAGTGAEEQAAPRPEWAGPVEEPEEQPEELPEGLFRGAGRDDVRDEGDAEERGRQEAWNELLHSAEGEGPRRRPWWRPGG